MSCEDDYESLMGTTLEVAFFPYFMSKSPNIKKALKYRTRKPDTDWNRAPT
jgi:hypothetical protein